MAHKEPLVLSMEKDIEFLRSEILSKNKIIELLVRERSHTGLTTEKNSYKLETNSNLQFEFPKRPVKSKQPVKESIPLYNRYNDLPTIETEKDNVSSSELIDQKNMNQINVTDRKSRIRTKINRNNNGKNATKDNGPTDNNEKINGNNSKKSVTCIIGDSMIKNIQSWKLNKNLKKTFVVTKSFSGATTEDMYDYVKPAIKHKPNRFLVHVGTNDLKSAETASQVAKGIINFALSCSKEADVPVIVSSLITRDDNLYQKVEAVNEILEKSCEERNMGFIDNSNITNNDLNGSKLHLNKTGVSKLENNFKHFINKV